jgi:hypothetical protein
MLLKVQKLDLGTNNFPEIKAVYKIGNFIQCGMDVVCSRTHSNYSNPRSLPEIIFADFGNGNIVSGACPRNNFLKELPFFFEGTTFGKPQLDGQYAHHHCHPNPPPLNFFDN